jgi:hypothetical protein
MPGEDERMARMMKRQVDRIDRLENERFQEGVPNPLTSVSEASTSDDSVTVSSKSAGSMSWGDSWSTSEWNGGG